MAQAYFFSVLGTFFDRFFVRLSDPTMTCVLVGRVQPEYLQARGLFLPKALLKLSNQEPTANKVCVTRRN